MILSNFCKGLIASIFGRRESGDEDVLQYCPENGDSSFAREIDNHARDYRVS
jgi:hypothetical protein